MRNEQVVPCNNSCSRQRAPAGECEWQWKIEFSHGSILWSEGARNGGAIATFPSHLKRRACMQRTFSVQHPPALILFIHSSAAAKNRRRHTSRGRTQSIGAAGKFTRTEKFLCHKVAAAAHCLHDGSTVCNYRAVLPLPYLVLTLPTQRRRPPSRLCCLRRRRPLAHCMIIQ